MSIAYYLFVWSCCFCAYESSFYLNFSVACSPSCVVEAIVWSGCKISRKTTIEQQIEFGNRRCEIAVLGTCCLFAGAVKIDLVDSENNDKN